ncbi:MULTISPECIES: N-acetyl-gamma-glutamyl-phosphate reductase [Rhodomicrobium]|uniref:N-acetyl-gamma-glutamyl-phosphate reductase n=1 Tax=Rhodomicrobium TaxID=1068 RepID=UPI000B4AD108|nr:MULTISPECIES: N-acetyl-gamma-glutamyl-phosphate reductase [Rhodomicrobium]
MASGAGIRIGVLGASGYTGADLIRLAACHPNMEIGVLAASSHAGKPLAGVFPHFAFLKAPDLVKAEDADWSGCDAVFSGLPHGTAQDLIKHLPGHVKIIDMSADFRLRDVDVYAQWYGRSHDAQDLLAEAAYGLTEHNAEAIAAARLVACPGCYPTAALLSLLPPVAAGMIDAGDLIIDAKSGVTGAGRSLKQNLLMAEAGEGLSPYGIGTHRHAPEIEQEIGKVAGRAVVVNFTPHLIPMSRGELVTCYVRLQGGATADDLRASLSAAYAEKPFVHVAAKGVIPATQNVRGSNYCQIGVFADRVPGRAIIIGVIDNLVKGSAGQAIQNFNLMFGLPETAGLQQLPLFP